MTTSFKLLSLSLVTSVFAYTAAAQEASTAQVEAAEAATQDGSQDGQTLDNGLSLGTPADEAEANQEPQIGDTYITSTSAEWSTRCLKTPEGQDDPCQLYQLLSNQDGEPAAEFSIFPLTDGGRAVAGATAIVPLETLLPKQITVQIDKGDARIYPFSFCNLTGCVARIGFTKAELAALKKGSTARLTMFRAALPDEPVTLEASLIGFTAGYKSLKGAQ